ncbi:YkgJ family cysteine cluster protein [Natronobiforma cellulositropha]|uniref:YkgJ family cysteine cluster protein n=1 Tax=Natronobiforma cellulositropha TaxID=1679076 RepID=UPI0021D595B8|nr:YkgJ family cysteine cluster protein [Natronobiforma cellulositropha]
MEVNCAGCAGCCVDWRALADGALERVGHERRGPYVPLDDTYDFVALEREEIRAFLEAGYGDALTVRLWDAENADSDDGRSVEVDGHRLAAVAGQPTFFVGLRKPPKPVAPVGVEDPAWLPTCLFLDPETLQCRIHGDDLYPAECRGYPAHNLALEQETECERVEAAFGGERLVDADPGETEGLLLGAQALGQKVFTHPRPETLSGVVERVARGALTRADRAEFVAVAAASSPGTLDIAHERYEAATAQALESDSWAGRALRRWTRLADDGRAPSAASVAASALEERLGAPATPGWDGLE